MLECSIGISAYNEAPNIGRLLERLLAQELESVRIAAIVVVASGCTDDTEAIVERWMARDDRIRLLTQATREGKASAINLFLTHAHTPLIVLCSGDLLPAVNTIEALVGPFADETVGMTSSRPVPINEKDNFMGFAAHLMWDLHHEMNLRHFKAGELIAFRKLFDELPPGTVTDEASIEPIIRAVPGFGFSISRRRLSTIVARRRCVILLCKGAETMPVTLSCRQRRATPSVP